MNYVRHLVRVGVLGFLAGVVILNYYNSLAQQLGGEKVIQGSAALRAVDKFMKMWPRRDPYAAANRAKRSGDSAQVQALLDDAMSGMPAPAAVKGTLWSMRLGTVTLSDPLAVVEYVARAKRPHWPFILSALVPVLVALILGRVFCSWICPMGIFSEIASALRRLAQHVGVDFPALSMPNSAKNVVLVVGLAVAVIAGVQVFYFIYPPRLVSAEVYHVLRVGKLGYASVFLAGLLVAEIVLVKRLWCRCLCPGGALYSMLGVTRLLRMRRDPERCIACRDCDEACPHLLAPSHLPLTGECDNCGLCRAACPTHALSYRFGGGYKAEPSASSRAPQSAHEPASEGSKPHV